MSEIHKVVFYPVGNGDSSQIILSSGVRILFDYCHHKEGNDDNEPFIDLASHLKDELKKSQRDYFDVVAFTHADVDHIKGSTEFFELQHASKYQGEGRIKINELWVPAAMLLEEATNDQQSNEFVILRQEARYRLLEGKDIRVFSKPKELMDWLIPKLKEKGLPETARDHLFVDAGTLVPGFNLSPDGVEFFCHSPFIKHCDEEGDTIRNKAALIFNVRFLADGELYNYLAIGDSEWDVLEDIVNITSYHNNMDRLEWDLYNLPHHCSYLSLSDEKGTSHTEPKEKIKDLLLKGKKDAYMVSSSKPILSDNDAYQQIQPPHVQAKNTYQNYLNKVNGRKILLTMEEPNTAMPKPLEFEIGRYGVTFKASGMTGAAAIIRTTPPRAGYMCKNIT